MGCVRATGFCFQQRFCHDARACFRLFTRSPGLNELEMTGSVARFIIDLEAVPLANSTVAELLAGKIFSDRY